MNDTTTSSSLNELKEKANAMLEAQLGYNPQLLAAAKAQMEEQVADSPEVFMRNMDNSPEGKIKQCRTKMGHYYSVVTKALDDPINAFLANNNNSDTNGNHQKCVFPAVDFAAGSAYGTYQWALRYRAPLLCDGSLEWYPTDTTDGLETLTRPCLKYLANGAESFLCITDRNGDDIFPAQRVQLTGLSNDDYNGQEGVLLRQDPKNVGRYAIQLDSKAKPISLKPDNFVRVGVSDHDSSKKNGDRLLVEGLLERSCNVDLLKRETWSELLKKVNGQCALVTCTNLLTEIGHREPAVWKTVMELASKLLVSGGFLLQGDADGWGQFGNLHLMEEYGKSLGLTLHTEVKLDAWALVLWKKC